MDIVRIIKKENGYTFDESIDIVETLLEILKSTLASGEDVLISGFGRFQVRDKHARKGRNPATDGEMIISPRRVVTFKWSGKLRNKVNGGIYDKGGKKGLAKANRRYDIYSTDMDNTCHGPM
jgi:integration host factor subunit alpha